MTKKCLFCSEKCLCSHDVSNSCFSTCISEDSGQYFIESEFNFEEFYDYDRFGIFYCPVCGKKLSDEF